MVVTKSRLLTAKRFLEEQTDEAHPVTMADIRARLDAGRHRDKPQNRRAGH